MAKTRIGSYLVNGMLWDDDNIIVKYNKQFPELVMIDVGDRVLTLNIEQLLAAIEKEKTK